MAENLGGKFATMSEDERRRFALQQQGAAGESSEELAFDDPRGDPGRTKANLEDRDGLGALVDDEQHQKRVREEARARDKRERRPE
ncbi:MAG: hypothetical protein H0T50_07170 [Gemmatimonadales bacterium]|nr:hypothetical protein [Gemmatimonadales bacterium]